MKPYFEEDGITIYHGDCREVLPMLTAECLITDPIWPHCEHVFPGIDAFALLSEALNLASVKRLVIHLGMWSDPRFLLAVPDTFKFLRVVYLEFAAKGYLGRLLRDADVGYIFGDPPASKPGAQVLPGRFIATKNDQFKGWGRQRPSDLSSEIAALPHPTTRHIQHLRWLVKWFAGTSVIDPFMGSGTTAKACQVQAVPFIGIEIEEKYCEIAAKRLSQKVLNFG
jgi:site-specific DNA-methyltransferase (adenine-specific)